MPEEKKERWGAYVKKQDDEFAPGGVYYVRIGKFDRALLKPGEMFTSNPKISERIAEINKEWKLNGKVLTGHINFFVLPRQKVVRLSTYLPFTGVNSQIPGELGKRLMGLGLASRIELRILKDLKKSFVGHKVVVRQIVAEEPRKLQLKHRGSGYLGKDSMIPIEFQAEIQRIANFVGGFAKRRQTARRRRIK